MGKQRKPPINGGKTNRIALHLIGCVVVVGPREFVCYANGSFARLLWEQIAFTVQSNLLRNLM